MDYLYLFLIPKTHFYETNWNCPGGYCFNCFTNVVSNCKYYPDSIFLTKLIEKGVDTNEDGQISYEEAETVTLLDLSTSSQPWISDLTGIEAFTNLTKLDCHGNGILSLDASNNTALEYLNCSQNQINSLDVSNNTVLEWLFCASNQLISLNISNNIALGTGYILWDCRYGCTDLDLSDMPSLQEVCVRESFLDTVMVDTTGSPNVYFTTECTIGTEEQTFKNISIYPNPVKNLITVETSNSDLLWIEITSLNGQLIVSREMEGTTHQIDLYDLQKGVYLITIRSKDFLTTRKIIKH